VVLGNTSYREREAMLVLQGNDIVEMTFLKLRSSYKDNLLKGYYPAPYPVPTNLVTIFFSIRRSRMNPFYDKLVPRKLFFPRWYWLFLWMLPTHVAFEEKVVKWKVWKGCIHIVNIEDYPKKEIKDDKR
jgi:hypothetical protein